MSDTHLTEPVRPGEATARLLLTPRETATALSVCEKTLWSLAKRGEIPVVRIGRAVRYSVADLNEFCEKAKGPKEMP